MLKEALKILVAGGDLDAPTMERAMGVVMDGGSDDALTAAFLVALRMKGETTDEIEGAARAMRQRMHPVSVDATPLLDTCGTGGSGTGKFNISTAVAFVAAAAGVYVAKHGNRAVSSRSGSADVLAALGVNLDLTPKQSATCIQTCGVGFLFAPNHHPAMKYAAPIRKSLGLRTIFNVLGPLTNPAGAPYQLMGCFDRALTAPLAETLGRLGSRKAWVVAAQDGLDELSLSAPTQVSEWNGESVETFEVRSEDVGLESASLADIVGGSPDENAVVFRDVLSGQAAGPIEDIVALNAGAALTVCNAATDLPSGVAKARALLRAGTPAKTLEALVACSQSFKGA